MSNPFLVALLLGAASGHSLANPFKILGLGSEARLESRCRSLVDWGGGDVGAQQARQVQPPMQRPLPQRTAPDLMARHPELRLFADERFVPVFGKAFDALSPSERLLAYQDNFVACMRSPTYAQAVIQLQARVGMPFQDMGAAQGYGRGLTAAMVTEAVRKLRGGSAAFKARANATESLPPGWAGWEQWQAQLPLLEADVGYLPTAEQQEARNRIAQLTERFGAAAARELLAAPRPSPRRWTLGPNFVAPAPNSLAWATTAAPKPSPPAANSSGAELQAMAPSALADSAAWHARVFRALSDPEPRNLAAVQDLARDYQARRREQLALAEPQWLHRASAAADGAALAQLQREALSASGDAESPTGQRLNAAINARREQFHKADVLGQQLVQAPPAAGVRPAVSPTTSPATSPATPTSSGEPTAEEMYYAVQRQLRNVASGTTEMQSKGCAGVRNSRGNPNGGNAMDAMACLMGSMLNSQGAGQPMKISRFQKIACSPANGQAGWVCDYVIGITGGAMSAMGQTFGGMLAGGSTSQARFVRGEQGWMLVPGPKSDR